MKEITLSDGTKVKILKGKGKDYIQARTLASEAGEDFILYLVQMLTQKENGEKFTVEELQELPVGDYMALESAVFDVNPLPENLKRSSSPLSGKDSPTQS